MVWQETVNLPTYVTTGSIPVISTKISLTDGVQYDKLSVHSRCSLMVEFVVWDHETEVRFFLPRPFLLGVSVEVTHQTLTLLSLVRSQYPLPLNFKGVVYETKENRART